MRETGRPSQSSWLTSAGGPTLLCQTQSPEQEPQGVWTQSTGRGERKVYQESNSVKISEVPLASAHPQTSGSSPDCKLIPRPTALFGLHMQSSVGSTVQHCYYDNIHRVSPSSKVRWFLRPHQSILGICLITSKHSWNCLTTSKIWLEN